MSSENISALIASLQGNGAVNGLNADISFPASTGVSNANDLATKSYVDGIAEGLHVLTPVNAATNDTLANITSGTISYDNGTEGEGATLTTSSGNFNTIDGVSISTNDRILVKDEVNNANNGIYTKTSETVLTRSTDFDSHEEIRIGDFTFVEGGTQFGSQGFVMTGDSSRFNSKGTNGTVGTDDIIFTKFSGISNSISGNKTFTDDFQTDDNTTLCNSSGDLIIGDSDQSNHNRPTATFMSGISQRFNVQTDLVGDEDISGRLEYQKNLRIQQRSYHSPYHLSDYFLPNMPSTTYLYDHSTKLTGDTYSTPYRVIKLHPQNWTPNEDSTANDIAIYDPGIYPTTNTTTTYGGLMARHSAIIEAWSYFDIPEGLKLKAVFLRIASSTTGASFISKNVRVFKRHLGELSTQAQYSVKIVDDVTATSGNTPIYALTSGIDQQDLINEYDNYMAIRSEINDLSYVLMGGYVICEPVDLNNLAYSIDITSGSSHYSNFTITIKDELSPNTTLASKEFTGKTQTKNFIIPYTYGATRKFIIQFGQSDDAMSYQYSLLCNRCEVEDSTSPTIDDIVSNGLTLVRQTSTISFSQIPA